MSQFLHASSRHHIAQNKLYAAICAVDEALEQVAALDGSLAAGPRPYGQAHAALYAVRLTLGHADALMQEIEEAHPFPAPIVGIPA